MSFEAMPQIADLEIAATWDEIELEAALRGRGADAPGSASAEVPADLAEALRAVESLKQLPREERKRRAEELLRALTSAPAVPPPQPEASPQSVEQTSADASSTIEPIAAAAETAPAPAEEPSSEELVSPEPAMPSAELFAPAVAEVPTPVLVEAEAAPPPPIELPDDMPIVTEAVSTAEVPVAEPDHALPDALESPERSTAEPVPEPIVVAEPPATDALVIVDPAPQEPDASPAAVESVPQGAPETPTAPPPAPLLDAIPKFLTTECTALEPEQPDSLIPLRAVAATAALLGAVLLVYFWSSQEFGVAARPIIGASETSEAHPTLPRISASQAARQAFVAPPLDFAMGPQSVRPHRPAMMGFDLFDDPPNAAIAIKAEVAPAAAKTVPLVPQSSAEATAAMPAADSDAAALIKRGDDLLKAGDIAAARSAFERAAASGNAKAQIGVGKTYDPLVLAKLGARGVRGDPVQAASWYARAGEAGDEEGQQRLHALISGLSDCMLAQGTCASRKP